MIVRKLNLCAICLLTLASFANAAEGSNDLPVKIYVLIGQSNMQGKAGVEGDGAGSLRYIVTNDPKKEFQFLVDKDGKWIERKDVWINLLGVKSGDLKPGSGSMSNHIGPEIGFGHKIGDVNEGQVLLIKTCWGGKSLGNDFLPPSVGKYPQPERPGQPGYYYHEVLRIVKEVTENIRTHFPAYKGQGIEVAGICYHQGWNDQYAGMDTKYEKNLEAFIKDIRSTEHGFGVPDLPFVIATSGMIEKESLVKQGQLAVGDKQKYPQFAGSVAVVDTDKPYGPDSMTFKFYPNPDSKKVGYHWNRHAASYTNIGRAMAEEMKKLVRPTLPSRLRANGTAAGVELTWQLGRESPRAIKLLRNGNEVNQKLSPAQTLFVDTEALPGKNGYELVLDMPTSPQQKLTASCDTSITDLTSYRSMNGALLQWKARGKYDGFKVLRDGKVIAGSLPGEARSYEDKDSPDEGKVVYTVMPSTGDVTPATIAVNRGPIDPGDAVVYEPFDYPSDPGKPLSLLGIKGGVGMKGEYYTLQELKKKGEKPRWAPTVIAGGLAYGGLPVTGNKGGVHRWGSAGCAIALDESLEKAGLLKDGATLWISYLFYINGGGQQCGGGMITLRSEDMKEGIGFAAGDRAYQTVVLKDGKQMWKRIGPTLRLTPTLVVGKIVWGKDGKDDTFVPYTPGLDLKQPEKHGRVAAPFNIDQTRLNRLVLSSQGMFDEIRVGPTYESVIGGGTQ